MCDGAKDPKGRWVEYMWPRKKGEQPSRKIAFIIQVPGQPYQVAAGIYNDTITLDELNSKR
ncbi:MAG: cache domain-containing protein [Deltaproteobacteria bacterium]|nr:cache domain-containing protein [Deltaproteobacteria bacterium]